jgi:hypothetical protein
MASTRVEATKTGITFGSALAMAISFNVNQSVLWALIHGVFSWFYVVYYVVFKEQGAGLGGTVTPADRSAVRCKPRRRGGPTYFGAIRPRHISSRICHEACGFRRSARFPYHKVDRLRHKVDRLRHKVDRL